jgi:hypothetical protein
MKINIAITTVFCCLLLLSSTVRVNGQIHSDQNGLKSSVISDLTANNTQAMRYEVATVGFNSYHWQPGGVIVIELFQRSFTTGYQRYIIDNGFGRGINSGQIKISLVESSGLEQLAKVTLGTSYDLPSNYGGFVNKAYPIYIDVRYFANYRVKITYQQERVESLNYMDQIKVNTTPVPVEISDFSVPLLSDNPLTSTSNLMVTGEGTHYISKGNVGMGTTTPNYPLDVARYMSVGAQGGMDIAVLGGGAGIGAMLKLYYANGVENTRLMGNNDSWLNAYAGNVGVGLTNPTEKLTVNGKIKAKEIRVDGQGAPDYVFEKGYKVATLEALESYIKKNKHLPDVPSAKEFERDGIAVGEMSKLLLKNLEELTLHLIEKDKALNVQRADINVLKMQVADQQRMLLTLQSQVKKAITAQMKRK